MQDLTSFSGQDNLICYESAQNFLAELCFQILLAAKLCFCPVIILIAFIQSPRVKSGKTMLPARGKTMGKVI